MDFDILAKDILGLDSKVRFAGVCDDSGGIKYGGQRENMQCQNIRKSNG
jgi:hypothetical protein